MCNKIRHRPFLPLYLVLLAVSLLTGCNLERGELPTQTPLVHGLGAPLEGKYFLIDVLTVVEATGTVETSTGPEFTGYYYRFDPETGSLRGEQGTSVTLEPAAWGFIQHFSGGALQTITALPCNPWTAFTNQISIQVVAIDAVGNVELVVDAAHIVVPPDRRPWTHRVTKEVHTATQEGTEITTITLTNYGWYDQ